MNPTEHTCPMCIDGAAPADIHPILGACYTTCPLCHTRCDECGGTGRYPAITGHPLDVLIDALYHLGVGIDNCRHCLGLIFYPPHHTPVEVDPMNWRCPECGEPATHQPPAKSAWLQTWTNTGHPPPEWSHLDGTPLCPIPGPDGYHPATPTTEADT